MAPPSSPPTNSRKGEPLSQRSYNLHLTFSSLVTAGIVLIIGIGWAFVLGVMVGRGYNPEKKVPQLSRWLPEEEQTADKEKKPGNVGEILPRAEVMRLEDLNYATSLRDKPGERSKPAPQRNATLRPVQAPSASRGGVIQAGADRPPAAERPAPPAVPQPSSPPPTSSQELFDYTFQVATFKDTDAVNALRVRLEGEGYRSRMDKDGKLYKVMVLMRGNQERAAALQEQMKAMGLGQPIQRGKTPAGKARRN